MRREPTAHARLFILGGKGVAEAEIRRVFGKFGTIEDVFKPKDKRTREDKAVFYVTYMKASEAALALEEMDGQAPFSDNNRSLRVVLAADKSEGNKKEDEKLLRLFIKCSKNETEDEIQKVFQEWGDVESVTVLKDHQTGESRGLAYVKYYRPYHAALAYENCPEEYKPKFAESKTRAAAKRYSDDDYRPSNREDRYGGPADRYSSRSREDRYGDSYGDLYRHSRDEGRSLMGLMRGTPNHGSTVLELMVSPVVTHSQLQALCDLVPGLTTVDFERVTGSFLVNYATPEAAAYAKERLDGFEYPPGQRIAAWFPRTRYSASYDPPPMRRSSSADVTGLANELRSARSRLDPSDNMSSSLRFIADFVKKASGVLDTVGGRSSSSSAGLSSLDEEQVRFCNIPLPLTKPFAHRDAECMQRLFIVSQPDAIPVHILEDVFCRFGDLITVYFMGGRNCGYAKYASKSSAQRAIDLLHGQTIYGMRFKVMLADPPPGEDEPVYKKPRN